MALARALYRKAQILILDEATSALDEATRDRLLATFRKIAPNLATLVITHDPAVAQVADRVAGMADSTRHIDAGASTRPAMRSVRRESSPRQMAAA